MSRRRVTHRVPTWIAVLVATLCLGLPVSPSARAGVDAFAGACFVELSATRLPLTGQVTLTTLPGSLCVTNEGTGSMDLSGTLTAIPEYGCLWGGARGPVSFSVDAAFDSFSATDVDMTLVNAGGEVAVALALHTGSQHVAGTGSLREASTQVEECLGAVATVTMNGVITFETPTDLSCCPL